MNANTTDAGSRREQIDLMLAIIDNSACNWRHSCGSMADKFDLESSQKSGFNN